MLKFIEPNIIVSDFNIPKIKPIVEIIDFPLQSCINLKIISQNVLDIARI